MERPEPCGRGAAWARAVLLPPTLALAAWALLRSGGWQDSIRLAMDMAPVEDAHAPRIALIASAVFGALMLMGWAARGLFDLLRGRLRRIAPPRVADVLGALLAGAVVLVVTGDGTVAVPSTTVAHRAKL